MGLEHDPTIATEELRVVVDDLPAGSFAISGAVHSGYGDAAPTRQCSEMAPELQWAASMPDDRNTQEALTPEQQKLADAGNVRFDQNGNPFDESRGIDAVERWRIGTFDTAAGPIVVMDGSAVTVGPSFFSDEGIALALAGDQADLFFTLGVTEQSTVETVDPVTGAASSRYASTSGVLVQTVGSSVATWADLEFAYGTDGGSGGLISTQALQTATEEEPSHLSDNYYLDGDWSGWNAEPQMCAALDNAGLIDAVVFSNDLGDGAFPMSRGYDASEQLVAVHIWHMSAPWRLANPEGQPPNDVTTREREISACLAGERVVESWGFCS